MKKLSAHFIEAQTALCQEAIYSMNIDEVARLSNDALSIANDHERDSLLFMLKSYNIFSSFPIYLHLNEKIAFLNDFDIYREPDAKWETDQLESCFKDFIITDKSETAIEAIQRYYNYTTVLQQKSPEQYMQNQLVFYSPPVSNTQVKDIETSNGIVLPKAYVNFITKIGFFSFGNDFNDVHSTALLPIKRLTKQSIFDALYIEDTPQFYGYKSEDLQSGYVVIENPEDHYRTYELGFFLKDHLNKKGELLFINGDQDGFHEHENFDTYIQEMINSRIRNSLEERNDW